MHGYDLTTNICKACRQNKKLKNSHAIPRSFIKDLLRLDSGKAVYLSSGSEQAQLRGDISKDPLLCGDCEHVFGIKYDRPIKEFFVEIRKLFNSGIHIIQIENGSIYKQALASILWRAAISKAPLYYGFRLNEREIVNLFLDMQNTRDFNFSYKIQPIWDAKSTNLFDKKLIDVFMLSPRLWGCQIGNFKRSQKVRLGFIFIAGGIAIHVIERISKTKERQRSYIRDQSCSISLQPTNVWEVPGFEELIFKAIDKENNLKMNQ